MDLRLLLDTFTVSAVASLLLIRSFVLLTGYTSINIGSWHITHVQWGGALMVFAIIIMQSFITRAARRLGAIMGGIGFGLFIDDLGRYSLATHDYYYRPAFAVIYAVFVALYLGVRFFLLKNKLSSRENLVNAFEFAKEEAADGLDRRQRLQAHELIAGADSDHRLHTAAQALLKIIDQEPPRQPLIIDRLLRNGSTYYAKWSRTKLYQWIIIACFMAIGAYAVYGIVDLIRNLISTGKFPAHHWVVFIAYLFSIKGILIGDIRLLRGKRLSAYHWFNEALLVFLVIVQVFVFMQTPAKGLISLLVILVLLGAVRFMIAEEKTLQLKKAYTNAPK